MNFFFFGGGGEGSNNLDEIAGRAKNKKKGKEKKRKERKIKLSFKSQNAQNEYFHSKSIYKWKRRNSFRNLIH